MMLFISKGLESNLIYMLPLFFVIITLHPTSQLARLDSTIAKNLFPLSFTFIFKLISICGYDCSFKKRISIVFLGFYQF